MNSKTGWVVSGQDLRGGTISLGRSVRHLGETVRVVGAAVRDVLPLFPELEGQKVRVETVESANRFVRWALAGDPLGSTRNRLPWESTFVVRLRRDAIEGDSGRFRAILSHELTHIRQRLGQVPVVRYWDPWGEGKTMFEKVCDLHTLVKVGEVFPMRPTYLQVPGPITKEGWLEHVPRAVRLAREALTLGGGAESVKWWEEAFGRG